ncbi:MAG: hypothetical protein KDC83_01140 [Flavobacteriales bacterium]|nr:hypothetical protein [Flavobacteriales bacterium]
MKWRIALFFILAIGNLLAQPFGNEWINFNQKYLKIPIIASDVYRLDYATLKPALTNIGIDINSLDPRALQLFSRGQETFIHISGESDGSFDVGDFILFYGSKNDGWFDAELYAQASHQMNPYYSNFNDTAFVFLTLASSINNKRLRIITNQNFAGKTAEPFVWNEVINYGAASYNEGPKDGNGVSAPTYEEGEGWITRMIGINGVHQFTLSTPNPYIQTGAPDALIKTNTAGASNAAQSPNHGLEISYGIGSSKIKVVDIEYTGYKMNLHQFNVPNAALSSALTLYYEQQLSPAPASDYQVISYASMLYPRSTILSGQSFVEGRIPASTDTSFLNFSNYSGSASYAFDFEGGYMALIGQSGSTINFLLPPGAERKFIVTNDNNWNQITDLRPVSNFKERNKGQFVDYKNYEEDSALVVISHIGLENEALQYVNFKRALGQNAILIPVEDLYDQFAHGIQKHPLAISHFVSFISTIWSSKPSGLFLIGKSVKENLTRTNSSNYSLNKIPTMGVPPADNLLAVRKSSVSITPEFPVGRLSASNSNEVLAYLNKMREFSDANSNSSSNPDNMIWQKRGIHIAGGGNINEQAIFKRYLDGFKSIWEDSAQGGQIFDFERYVSGAVQNIKFDSIEILVNGGVSLLSFFGHGSGGELGINIGEPSDFNNQGKYPLFLTNSCNVGDYHLPNTSGTTLNERWILTPNKGAIGFLSSTSLGYPSVLNIYSQSLYTNLCRLYYGQSIGYSMKETIKELENGGAFLHRTCLEMNLHGDPTAVLYARQKPDFSIRKSDVNAPEVISTDEFVLNMSIPIYNLGRAYGGDVPVKIQRIYPNGKDTTFQVIAHGIKFSQTIKLSFFIADEASIGENTFTIHVNPEQVIDELYPVENNVIGNLKINVTSDDLLPIYPYDFAIIPDKNVILQASTADPHAAEREYIFEIDINHQFNSNMLRRQIVKSKGGVVSWNPGITHAPDSIVYYWRVSPNKALNEQLKWRESSFQIIPKKTGWSQYRFPQLSDNLYSNLIYNATLETIDFLSGNNTVSGTNKGRPTISELNSIKWSINGSQQGRTSVCGARPGMLISVIDNSSVESWETRWNDISTTPPTLRNPDKNFGNFNDPAQSSCPQRDRKFHFILADPKSMDSMASMLNNHIPDSFYVIAMSLNGAFQDSNIWKNRHFQAFEDLGADSIRTIPSDFPYIFFGQKGNLKRARNITATTGTELLSFSENISGKISRGSMSSTKIGPTRKWKELHWNVQRTSPNDSFTVSLYGLDKNGVRNLVAEFNESQRHFSSLDLQFPEINKYHELELEAKFRDTAQLSAPKFKHWFIIHNEVPEAAISLADGYSFIQDTVRQGQPIYLNYAIKNVSPIDFDSLRVRYYLIKNNDQIIELPRPKLPPLKGHVVFIDSLEVSTRKLSGLYTLAIDVNPEDSLWQPEKQHFNNILFKSFYVIADNVNPLLDITFDGIHILDGDIVSARPNILVSLNDDNEFMPLEDTSSFEIYLSHPSGTAKRIYFKDATGADIMTFNPPTGKKNKATIEYKPILGTDGIYTLRVKAADVSGNQSGENDYAIRFEVINRSTITKVMNYPNPFTTSTRFVFTLTGYIIPDYFRIQILNISGRVIKEIDRDELGNIHIGRNITEYAWDGTDTYGDRLANGVYFYRVITKIEGEEIENRDSGADPYFKKGFGKMVLFR